MALTRIAQRRILGAFYSLPGLLPEEELDAEMAMFRRKSEQGSGDDMDLGVMLQLGIESAPMQLSDKEEGVLWVQGQR